MSSNADSASRFAMRRAFDENRGSLFNSIAPSTFSIRSQFAWFAAPTLIQPSAVANAW